MTTHDDRVERAAKAIAKTSAHMQGDLMAVWDDHTPEDQWAFREMARAALAALDAEPSLEDVLLSSGLVSDGLPGHDIAITYHDNAWAVQQNRVTLTVSWPTNIHGTGQTIAEAIRNAVEAVKGAGE